MRKTHQLRVFVMRKRISALIVCLALVLSVTAFPLTAAAVSVDDAAVLYTPSSDYKSGDCILTATKVMLRRASIQRGKEWSNITNASLRGRATISGLLLWSFTVDVNSIEYKMAHGSFKGKNKSERTAEIAALLAKHPEGIVVHGTSAAKKGGAHGVLAVKVKDGVIYASDSTNNLGSKNYGIQKWSDTTMKADPKCVTAYWYIESSGPGKSINGSVNGTQVSKIKITSYRVPKKIKKGRGFNIKGKVKSNNKLTNVTVQVIDSSGNVLQSASKNPNSKSYNVKKLNKKIKFGRLKRGNYTYQVTASDTLSSKTLLNRSFKVK